MITAIDTNILLDILNPDEPFRRSSEQALRDALRAGDVVICEPVFAELSAHFADESRMNEFLNEVSLRIHPSARETLYQAGQAWARYTRERRSSGPECPRCGAAGSFNCGQCGSPIRMRQHVLADFLIAAHASAHADRLITRDKGYYETYFPALTLI